MISYQVFHLSRHFRFEEDDDDDSDGEGRDSFVENVEFEPLPVYELVDPSLNCWVHHMQHILPQGRCQWVNPSMKTENEEFDEVKCDHVTKW